MTRYQAMIEPANDSFEICRILSELNFDGQRTLVTPDSFAKPDIQLVCKILNWFLKILKLSCTNDQLKTDKSEPKSNYVAAHDIEIVPPQVAQPLRASDYVEFLVHCGRVCYELLGVKLDLVALCRADRACCSQLLLVAVPIFEAAKLVVEERTRQSLTKADAWLRGELEARRDCCKALFDYTSQGDNMDELSTRCNQMSEELQVMLKDEEAHQDERLRVIERRLEIGDIERVLADSLGGIKQETEHLRRSNAELEQDLVRLDEKLASKEAEISETRRKLSELLVKSPAYASQYEALKQRYETAYERYVSSYRNLAHLKSCGAAGATTSDESNLVDLVDDVDDCWRLYDDNSYRDWLSRHGIGIGRFGSVAGRRSIKPSDATGDSLLVFEDDDTGATRSDSVRPMASRGTIRRDRLLESLLGLTTDTTDPIRKSPPTGDERTSHNLDYGSRALRSPSDLADPALELEGLLDEFAPHDTSGRPGQVGVGSSEGGEIDDDDDDEEDDHDEEDEENDDDDDDLIG